jgi:hypothetical protein
MKQHTYTGTLLLILSLLLAVGAAQAQDKKKPAAMPSQEEMMKRWQAFMTPGAEHKALAEMVGSWNLESKYWVAGPGQGQPEVSTGSSEYSMAMDGRYLIERTSATMMGRPFTGMGITGYDNFKKKFVGAWIDDMGTSILTMEGTMESGGKSLVMWGTMDEPGTGEKNKRVKYVWTFTDKDTRTFEAFDVDTYGDKAPMMSMTYTRKK